MTDSDDGFNEGPYSCDDCNDLIYDRDRPTRCSCGEFYPELKKFDR